MPVGDKEIGRPDTWNCYCYCYREYEKRKYVAWILAIVIVIVIEKKKNRIYRPDTPVISTSQKVYVMVFVVGLFRIRK